MYPVSWKYRKDGRFTISIDELIIDYKKEFYIYESLAEMIKRINDDFNLMAIVCSISYYPITRRIYLFIPPEVVFTFFDDVQLTLDFTKTNYKGTQNKNSNVRASYICEIVKLNISELGNFYIF
jgi:hypothetical protein